MGWGSRKLLIDQYFIAKLGASDYVNPAIHEELCYLVPISTGDTMDDILLDAPAIGDDRSSNDRNEVSSVAIIPGSYLRNQVVVKVVYDPPQGWQRMNEWGESWQWRGRAQRHHITSVKKDSDQTHYAYAGGAVTHSARLVGTQIGPDGEGCDAYFGEGAPSVLKVFGRSESSLPGGSEAAYLSRLDSKLAKWQEDDPVAGFQFLMLAYDFGRAESGKYMVQLDFMMMAPPTNLSADIYNPAAPSTPVNISYDADAFDYVWERGEKISSATADSKIIMDLHVAAVQTRLSLGAGFAVDLLGRPVDWS